MTGESRAFDGMRVDPEITIVAACVLCAAAWGSYQALPVVLGALAQHRGFTDQEIGWLGSAELFGMLIVRANAR